MSSGRSNVCSAASPPTCRNASPRRSPVGAGFARWPRIYSTRGNGRSSRRLRPRRGGAGSPRKNGAVPPQGVVGGMASFDKKKRGDLTQRVGRAYRKLGGDAALQTFDRPEDMPAYCRLMNEVYARTWHHADLPTDWEAAERVALFTRLAAAGQLIGH